jgi:GxxExxY protein
MEINAITHEVIGSSIKIHRCFGPGMLESAFVLPLIYDGITIDAGYRLDLRVSGVVIVEVRAVEVVLPIHKAQLLCYMRLSGCRMGLIINFNEVRLVDGITRIILD